MSRFRLTLGVCTSVNRTRQVCSLHISMLAGTQPLQTSRNIVCGLDLNSSNETFSLTVLSMRNRREQPEFVIRHFLSVCVPANMEMYRLHTYLVRLTLMQTPKVSRNRLIDRVISCAVSSG